MKLAKEQSLKNWTAEFKSQRTIKFDSELVEIK